jgi:hypothetical protein
MRPQLAASTDILLLLLQRLRRRLLWLLLLNYRLPLLRRRQQCWCCCWLQQALLTLPGCFLLLLLLHRLHGHMFVKHFFTCVLLDAARPAQLLAWRALHVNIKVLLLLLLLLLLGFISSNHNCRRRASCCHCAAAAAIAATCSPKSSCCCSCCCCWSRACIGCQLRLRPCAPIRTLCGCECHKPRWQRRQNHWHIWGSILIVTIKVIWFWCFALLLGTAAAAKPAAAAGCTLAAALPWGAAAEPASAAAFVGRAAVVVGMWACVANVSVFFRNDRWQLVEVSNYDYLQHCMQHCSAAQPRQQVHEKHVM